ncbi:MAG: hypothetical protein ACMUIG_01600 [Thermoplasmatota archaeon]
MTTIVYNNLLFLIISFILICGCVSLPNNDDDIDIYYQYWEIYYEIKIFSNDRVEMYLPIPLNSPTNTVEETNFSKIIDELDNINCNCIMSIFQTEKGISLYINFTSYIHLYGKKRIDNESMLYDDYFVTDLSLKNMSGNHLYYFFSSNENVLVDTFYCYFDLYNSFEYVRYNSWSIDNQNLQSGWNSVLLH